MSNKRLSGVPRNRRTFIKTIPVAGGIGVAGCLGGDGDTSENGSNGEINEDEDIELTFNSGLEEESLERYEEAMHEVGLPENIQLSLEPLPDGGQRVQAWEQWFSTGRSEPDLMQIDAQGLRFAQEDGLLNLSEYISNEAEEDINSRMVDGLVDVFTVNDDLYAMPLLIDIAVMHYNKAFVEQAGYNPDEENWATNPMSWEEFAHVIEDARDEAGVDYGYGWQTRHKFAQADFYEKVASWGGNYFGNNAPDENVGDREITVNEEPVLNALRMARSHIQGPDGEDVLDYPQISPEAVLQWETDPILDQMGTEAMVATRNWTFSIPVLGAEDSLGEDLGIMPMPYGVPEDEAAIDGVGGSRSALGGWFLGVNGNTENPDAAAAVVEAASKAESQLALFEHQGYAPPVPEMFTSDDVLELEVVGRYGESLEYAANHTAPNLENNPLWFGYQDRFTSSFREVIQGGAAPEEEMGELAEEIKEFEESRA